MLRRKVRLNVTWVSTGCFNPPTRLCREVGAAAQGREIWKGIIIGCSKLSYVLSGTLPLTGVLPKEQRIKKALVSNQSAIAVYA